MRLSGSTQVGVPARMNHPAAGVLDTLPALSDPGGLAAQQDLDVLLAGESWPGALIGRPPAVRPGALLGGRGALVVRYRPRGPVHPRRDAR